MYDDERRRFDEDADVPFTLGQRRRVDRLERAVQGYTDEGGVFIPGLLQNTADAVKAVHFIGKIGWGLIAIGVVNALHLYGISDSIARALLIGGGK